MFGGFVGKYNLINDSVRSVLCTGTKAQCEFVRDAFIKYNGRSDKFVIEPNTNRSLSDDMRDKLIDHLAEGDCEMYQQMSWRECYETACSGVVGYNDLSDEELMNCLKDRYCYQEEWDENYPAAKTLYNEAQAEIAVETIVLSNEGDNK